MALSQSSNKRIAKNTIVLYLRMLVILFITLYSSRVVLDVLGVSDYGIYNVVGGFVMMFSFLNSAMATASSRFIAYEQGIGNISRQIKVYSTSVIIHICIALIILLISESFGIWFINHKMVIPADRLYAANWVFQAALVSFVISILTVPLSASVIAHEKMSLYAYVSIIDAVLKLILVLILPYVNSDKLIFYSITLLIVSISDFTIYYVYCKRSFKECRFQFNKEKKLFMDMLSFAGWSFVGNFGISAKDYGVNIMLNLFCGTTVNAARGIAYQVTGAINGFVSNFQMAANPQITKRYAAGEYESMITLMRSASKYSFYLLGIIIIPVILRTDYILSLWLVKVPEYAVVFLQLVLIMQLVNTMYGPISTAMLATGKIMEYQISVAFIMCMDVPLSYIALKMGFSPYSVAVVGIITAFLALLVRLVILNRHLKIGFLNFVFGIILRNICVFIIMFAFSFFVNKCIGGNFIGLVLFSSLSAIGSLFIIICFGLSTPERLLIISKIKSTCKNIKQ